MLRQFLVGAAVSTCNIMIHALVMTVVVRVAQAVDARKTSRPWLHLIAVIFEVLRKTITRNAPAASVG
jgi:hypothetical protein